VTHGLRLAEEGADLVDVGGESSRPGAKEISVEEELKRVLPVVKGLVKEGVKVSVDTRKTEVARAALDEGACVINDVSGGTNYHMEGERPREPQAAVVKVHVRAAREDARPPCAMFEVVREARAGIVLMRGWNAAMAAGIAREALVIDPGIGFSNGADDDVALLRGIKEFAKIAPVMVGVSRKRFIGHLSGAAEPSQRLPGSIAAALFAVSLGAKILRVHDVAATAQALKVWEGLKKDFSS
jgi:dihydropteroate synthase